MSTERALESVKRAIRVEVRRELGAPQPPTAILPFPRANRNTGRKFIGDEEQHERRFMLALQAIVMTSVYRLVVHPDDAPGWQVMSLRIGMHHALSTLDPIDASAFAPLPAWLTSDAAPGTDELRRAMAAAPLENIERMTMHVGQVATLELEYEGSASPPCAPRAWLLVNPIE